MKRLIITITLGLCLLSGCSLNQQFVKASDGYAKVILPKYIKYVEADPKLKKDSKKIRVQSAVKWQQLIDAAKKK